MTTPDFSKLDDMLSSYISSDRLAGVVAAVISPKDVLYSKVSGFQDVERQSPMKWKSIFRIYSMTKPVTSIAAMMLWEEGVFGLDDLVSDYLPTYANTQVMEEDGRIRPANRQMTIRHLLCHTAGITLPAFAENQLVPLYLEQQIDGTRSKGCLEDVINRLGEIPVLFDPGSQWSYSMATDIVGRLVEIWSGTSLEDFLEQKLFNPLSMPDTGFYVKDHNPERFTSNYSVAEGKRGPVLDDATASAFLFPPEFVAGAGGLVSTADDYIQFLRMLLGRGTLDGFQLLKKETFDLMIENHLAGDMEDMGAAGFNDANWNGIGFGLGFHVVIDPSKANIKGPAGEFGWTGAAGTVFFVNPELNVATLLLTQYMPSKAYPLRADFKDAVYEGLL